MVLMPIAPGTLPAVIAAMQRAESARALVLDNPATLVETVSTRIGSGDSHGLDSVGV